MNLRFKQLAQEAGLYVDLKGSPWPKWMGAEECEVAYAKFAELIAKECITKIEEAAEDSPELYGVALDLMDHFGIEE